jgi:tetratricopeptide (TPR) repeat protein
MRNSVKLKPEFADAWFNLGATYEKQGRFEEEIDACLQAIKLKPDWAEAHYNLGVALSKLSRWAEAVEAFKQAVKIKSGYAEAHFNLGVACLNLGDQKAAKAVYETLKTLDADLAGRLLKLISQ